MALIPQNSEGGPWQLNLSEAASKRAEIRTAAVERKFVPLEIRMLGKIAYDEKRVGVISAWVPGRIDRLFVDYTGIEVQTGDHMVQLYSPELVAAQQELRQALKSLQSGHPSVQSAAGKRVAATREKLRLLGLSPSQIGVVETNESIAEQFTIEAPMGGIVLEKHLNEGAYVKTGTPIYTVADLSRVWINLDAYESDLAWLRYGQDVDFEVAAYAGETFHGRIVFIDPVLNPKTRTLVVRLDIPNPDGRLKPDMFVRAVAHALISPEGKVMDQSLAGMWICPMHPEIVKGHSGACDVCGMALVPAEKLGFVTAISSEPPLVIPATAPLITGERAVVYVADGTTYSGREILLGPQVGDFFVVREGLAVGERVVFNGAFKIDSELQIRARYSMMYHPAGTEPAIGPQAATHGEPAPAGVLDSLKPLLAAYFQLQNALSEDQLKTAMAAAAEMRQARDALTGGSLGDRALTDWRAWNMSLEKSLAELAAATTIEAARAVFATISGQVYQAIAGFGLPEDVTVHRFHCPMAFAGKGADWLQDHEGTKNPYFGALMLTCGDRLETLSGAKQEQRHE